jgi:hypothetical protein
MADLPPYPGANDDAGPRPDRGSTTRTARWVYLSWIIGIVLVLLFVALHLTGTIGPGRH